MKRREAMEAALSKALGRSVRITGERALGGGCINHAARLETDAGAFFAKWNDAHPAGLFSKEAACLEALRSAGSSLVVPEVIAWCDEPAFLVTELLEPGKRVADFDERLGRGLAELHRKSADAFGFEVDTYCGTTVQPNGWRTSWAEFYGEQRLAHQLRLMRENRLIGGGEVRAFERLIAGLPSLVGPEEPPALIHGDLWSGNLHVAPDGRPSIIDPASYFGHREAELGMMTLFGGFGERVYSAYSEAFPLASEWHSRNRLYQLYHLANHANLFGGSYVAQTMRIVERYG